MKKLSVVIPAYNEEENIKSGVLDQVYDYLGKQEYSWEVLIVDDKSTDNTAKLARSFCSKHKEFTLHEEPHRGKAGTVTAGMLKAKGEIVLFSDMDQSTPLKEIEKFFPKFESGYDGVIGTRSGRKGAPLIRKVMAYGFMFLRTIILRIPYKDTQCGFKAFTNEASQKLFSKLKVYGKNTEVKGAAVTAAFDIELLYIARKLGYKIAEVPVEWEHKGTQRVSAVKDSVDALKGMLNVRMNSLKGIYS